jgi:hypothetical protein
MASRLDGNSLPEPSRGGNIGGRYLAIFGPLQGSIMFKERHGGSEVDPASPVGSRNKNT